MVEVSDVVSLVEFVSPERIRLKLRVFLLKISSLLGTITANKVLYILKYQYDLYCMTHMDELFLMTHRGNVRKHVEAFSNPCLPLLWSRIQIR